jgi:release factor glutamine methyltransferase
VPSPPRWTFTGEQNTQQARGEDITGDSTSPKLRSVYEDSVRYLSKVGVPDAEDSARYLLCCAASLGYRYSDFTRALAEEPTRTLSIQQANTLRAFLRQRATRVPVQYILGDWDFFGLTLDCEAPVLIPRPETEELVEKVLVSTAAHAAADPNPNPNPNPDPPAPLRILDIGCGTGAIGLALLSQLPDATCVAIDVNPAAVSLSQRNAAAVLGEADATRRYKCILVSFAQWAQQADNAASVDIIVSNPPYIPAEEMAGLQPEVRLFEDERALCGGEDGLDVVREIVQKGPGLLRKGSKNIREIWMEVSHSHPHRIVSQVRDPDGELRHVYSLAEALRDLTGKDRFVRLQVKEVEGKGENEK